MAFHHNSTVFHTRSKDIDFKLQDILFTRTDSAGLIQEANLSFQEMSGFDEYGLIGQSHNIVRHPDMPKCVFATLWARLKQGSIASAYIMNRTNERGTYWVYSVIVPIPDGYIAIHIRPRADFLDEIRDIYRDLLELERAGTDAKTCSIQFQSRLLEKDFPSFASFCAVSVAHEVAERRAALHSGPCKQLPALEMMLVPLCDMGGAHKDLMESFDAIRGIPSNMRIVASRLEPAGGPISAISQNYRLMSDEVTAQLKSFYLKGTETPLSSAILTKVHDAMLYGGVGMLNEELSSKNAEQRSIKTEVRGESNEGALGLLGEYQAKRREALLDVSKYTEQLKRCSKDVRQLVTGLDSIRVLCRVEAGRLGADSAALLPIIDQLDKSHKKIDSTLGHIINMTEHVTDGVENARRN